MFLLVYRNKAWRKIITRMSIQNVYLYEEKWKNCMFDLLLSLYVIIYRLLFLDAVD